MKKLTMIASGLRAHFGGTRPLAFLLLFLCCSTFAFAQTTRISGKVTNIQGEPMSGVTVKAGSQTAVTDNDGYYALEATPGDSLQISYVGFRSVSRVITAGGTQLNLTLEPQENTLGDVVVVGYSSQRRNSITGAVSSVDMNSLSKTRIPEVGQALQGQVAGVFVAANTGAPGDGFKLRIRGESTLGNNDVLYVVDGVPTRDIP